MVSLALRKGVRDSNRSICSRSRMPPTLPEDGDQDPCLRERASLLISNATGLLTAEPPPPPKGRIALMQRDGNTADVPVPLEAAKTKPAAFSIFLPVAERKRLAAEVSA